MSKKIGIFGGTFDPVHMAHLHMAQCALEQAGLDKVIFVPNGTPPHKENSGITSGEHRYNMLVLATEDNPCFEVSDYELTKGGLCYTVDTMRYYKSAYPEHSFVFILGADSLDYLDRWYDGENLIRENSFLVAVRDFRDGYDIGANIRRIENMGGRISLIQMPPLDISATYIRETASQGHSVAYLTTPKVGQYIRDKELYK